VTGVYTSDDGGRAVIERYRSLLAQWPVPAEHLQVPTREGKTFVLASGPPDAPPLLLLHGSGSNAAMWAADVAVWSQHFRVYAVDIIGEPGLSARSRPPMAPDAYLPWLDDVAAALGVTRLSIVGISLGGWLALSFAARHPARVERMALLCPVGIGRQRWGAALTSALLKPFGAWGRRRSLTMVLGPAVRTLPGPAAEFVQLVNQHFRYRMEPVPVVTDDALRSATMPILVIVGMQDALVDSRGTRERLERLVPSATVRVLPDAGHLLPAQTAPILEFLRATHSTGSPR
jgi:pimeloyl-ACP methyl ester carboxylesterase